MLSTVGVGIIFSVATLLLRRLAGTGGSFVFGLINRQSVESINIHNGDLPELLPSSLSWSQGCETHSCLYDSSRRPSQTQQVIHISSQNYSLLSSLHQ